MTHRPTSTTILCLAVLFVFLAGPGWSPTFAADDRADHVVVLGDPHLPGSYSSRRVGNYLLVFLSTDHLLSPHLTQISHRQLEWLRQELKQHRGTSTVIFFHAPLRGTLFDFNDQQGRFHRAAPRGDQGDPSGEPPGLPVGGGAHARAATNESYLLAINVLQDQVTTVHVTDMQRERIWTTSLFLLPDRAVVKTFDHKNGGWAEDLERMVKPGQP